MKKDPILLDKKNYKISRTSVDELHSYNRHFTCYGKSFWVYRRDNTGMAKCYVSGLMRCEKNHTNMERMCEIDTENDYHRYYHFLSESKWDWEEVNSKTAVLASSVMQEQKSVNHLPVGLIIDESCHLKKGTESVGVSRQYAGQLGKVDNCQVAVYASLCNNNYCTLISSRLFLPESWTSNPERMDKAKIPEEYRSYKTKPELALKIFILSQ